MISRKSTNYQRLSNRCWFSFQNKKILWDSTFKGYSATRYYNIQRHHPFLKNNDGLLLWLPQYTGTYCPVSKTWIFEWIGRVWQLTTGTVRWDWPWQSKSLYAVYVNSCKYIYLVKNTFLEINANVHGLYSTVHVFHCVSSKYYL